MFRSLLAALLLLTVGCAYYNTFYNARESYEEALDYAREHPDDPAHHEKELLDAAVEGAGRVLARYPDSRWVDDAQLLHREPEPQEEKPQPEEEPPVLQPDDVSW